MTLPPEDFRAAIKEALISVESARAAAESLANHGIVPSTDLDAVLKHLDEAAESLTKIGPAPANENQP